MKHEIWCSGHRFQECDCVPRIMESLTNAAKEVDRMKITVTVSGPGGVINHEIDLIYKALIAAGHEVSVKNEDAFTEEQKKIATSRPPVTPWKIHLIADHQPWGG